MAQAQSTFEQLVMPLFEASNASEWLATARTVAVELGKTGNIVTVDMVREFCPPPSDVDPRIMGAVMPRKLWERVGYAQSSRAINHNRPIALFKLKSALTV